MNHGTAYRQILVTPFFMIDVTYIVGNLKHIGSGRRPCQKTNLGGHPFKSNGSSKLRLVEMFLPEQALFNACDPTSGENIIDDQTEYPMLKHLTRRFACLQAECKKPQTWKRTIRSSRFMPSAGSRDTDKDVQELGRAAASASKKTTEKTILITLEERLQKTDRDIKNRPQDIMNTAKGALPMGPQVAVLSTATAGTNIPVERYMQHERNRPRPRPAMVSPDDDDDDDTIGFHRVSTSNRRGSSNYSQNFLRSISYNKPYIAAQHKSTSKQLSWKCNDAAVAAIWRAVIARTCGQLPTIAWTPWVGTEDFVSDAGMHQMSLFVSVA